MAHDRESMEEYDDGFTRESFERADEDRPEDMEDPAEVREAYLEGLTPAQLACAVRTAELIAHDLLRFCKNNDLVVTITEVPCKPLAMGNFSLEVKVRLGAELRRLGKEIE